MRIHQEIFFRRWLMLCLLSLSLLFYLNHLMDCIFLILLTRGFLFLIILVVGYERYHTFQALFCQSFLVILRLFFVLYPLFLGILFLEIYPFFENYLLVLF